MKLFNSGDHKKVNKLCNVMTKQYDFMKQDPKLNQYPDNSDEENIDTEAAFLDLKPNTRKTYQEVIHGAKKDRSLNLSNKQAA